MRTHAPAPAPTYVDFVLAPAGLIGINTNSFGATRGATLRILKIPWMVPHPGDFFLNAQSCAGSKFFSCIPLASPTDRTILIQTSCLLPRASPVPRSPNSAHHHITGNHWYHYVMHTSSCARGSAVSSIHTSCARG